jgi:glycosyltransferase involved in cell wall biosynthesis
LPCVATATGNTPRVVVHEVTGLLVTTQDEWVEALKRLIDDPNLRRHFGQAARQVVLERYAKPAVALSYRQVLGEALGA